MRISFARTLSDFFFEADLLLRPRNGPFEKGRGNERSHDNHYNNGGENIVIDHAV